MTGVTPLWWDVTPLWWDNWELSDLVRGGDLTFTSHLPSEAGQENFSDCQNENAHLTDGSFTWPDILTTIQIHSLHTVLDRISTRAAPFITTSHKYGKRNWAETKH